MEVVLGHEEDECAGLDYVQWDIEHDAIGGPVNGNGAAAKRKRRREPV